jgi:NADPH:quinone reductase-like Zn-dependent oxidoreductase
VRVPAADELLVRVRASSVNRTDSGILRGKPFVVRFFSGFPRPRRTATGCDFAGEVEAIGSAVRGFAPGDRVFGLNDNGLGSHAQFVTVSATKTALHMPEGLSFADAVGCTEGAFYATNFLNKIDLHQQDRVLVIGGTGAIGSAAIQLLAARGVRVDAVCPVEQYDLVRSLGASELFDSSREDFLNVADPYDFVLDSVGKSRFSTCQPILSAHGVYVSSELGHRGENLRLPLTTKLSRGQRVVFPIPRDIKGSLTMVRDLIQRGSFRAVIDRTYPLDEIRQAFEYVESGQKISTVVLDPG